METIYLREIKEKKSKSKAKPAGRGRPKKGTPRKYFVPPKPYKNFELTPMAGGQWAKRINGQLFYFGRWGRTVNGKMERLPGDGWEDAKKLYDAQKDDLYAGREPQLVKEGELTVAIACNEFLTSKELRFDAGEISPSTFSDYKRVTKLLVDSFGNRKPVEHLTTRDFEVLRAKLSKVYGPSRLGTIVGITRSIFKYNRKGEIVPFDFKKPTKKDHRKHRAKSEPKLFTAEEIRWLLDGKQDDQGEEIAGADTHLRAMILLGINCAYGATDCSELTLKKVKARSGWLNAPRPKTFIDRRCPLWRETIAAMEKSLASRPKACNGDQECFFVTKYGNRWVRQNLHYKRDESGKQTLEKVSNCDSVAQEFSKLLKRLGINGRKGLGFYTLRHTFRTIADATRDFPAARLIMGHVDNSMDDVYREGIDDDRLEAVVNHVRKWLFGEGGEA